MSVVSGATESLVKTLDAGVEPNLLGFDPRNGYIYVPNSGGTNITVINGATNKVVGTIAGTGAPHSILFDPVNGLVYSPNWGGDLSVINGLSVTNYPLGTNPLNGAYDTANKYLYVANKGSDTVSVFNTVTNQTAKTIHVGTAPNFTAYDPLNGYIYVSNSGSGNVTIINGESNTVSGNPSIGTGSDPTDVIYDSSNEQIYVFDMGADTVTAVNGTTSGASKDIIHVGSSPMFGSYDPANHWVYVANSGGSNVTVINGSTNKIIETIAAGSHPWSAALDEGNGQVYLPNSGSNNITAVSTAVSHALAKATTGSTVKFVTADPWNGDVYVTNSGSNNITIVSGVTQKPVATVSDSNTKSPWGSVFDSTNGCIYVADEGTDYVTVICGTTWEKDVQVGEGPRFITFDPTNGYLYVMNYGGSTVTVINGATNAPVGSAISAGSAPQAATYDSTDGLLFVADQVSPGTVTVISTSTDSFVKTVAVGDFPANPVYDPSNGKVYVPNSEGSNVTVLKASTYTSLTSIPTGTEPRSATVDADNGLLYVPDYDGGITIVNQASSSPVATVADGGEPTFATLDPGNGLVYVENSAADDETVLNGTLDLASLNLGTSADPSSGCFDAGTSDVYVADAGLGAVSVIGMKGPVITILDLTLQPAGTNVTLAWHQLPARTAKVLLDWGNTSEQANGSVQPTFQTNVSVSAAGKADYLLGFLEPRTPYQFILKESVPGFLSTAESGNWTTTIDTDDRGFSGQINDTSGAPAPNGVLVVAFCADYPIGSPDSDYQSTETTGGAGHYHVAEPGWYDSSNFTTEPCNWRGGGYVVEMANHPIYRLDEENTVWNHHFNETVVTWAVQPINMVVGVNFVWASDRAQVVAFSNANSTDGLVNYTTLSYESSTTYTDTGTDCWQVGFAGGCVSKSQSVSTGSQWSESTGNLQLYQNYWVTETVEYSAIYNKWASTNYTFVEPSGSLHWLSPQPTVTDRLTPNLAEHNNSIYLLYSFGGPGSNNSGVEEFTGHWLTSFTTTGTTSSVSVVKSVDISAGVGVGEGVSAELSVSVLKLSWTQTVASGSESSLAFTLGGPSIPAMCYVVYGAGGTGAQEYGTADTIGVWAYPPSEGNECPLPS